VRGWLAGLGLILVLNLIAVGYWHYDDGLQDSFENLDTRVILQRLQQPHSIGGWFMGDWVLGNGFYRPLPSVLYQVDYWLWGKNLLAWKWTNGLLTTLNALLVVAFGWALSGRRDVALLGGFVFTYWQTGFLPEPPLWLGWVGLGAGTLWGWRAGDWRRGLLWGCIAFALVVELRFIPTLPDIHLQSFAYRAVGWIPGRTATLMTLFALLALVGTCLYARTGRLSWAALGLLGFLGALLSYEQAVALPILMGLCGLSVPLKQGAVSVGGDADATRCGTGIPARAVVGGDADATPRGTGIPARAVVGRDADATRCGTGIPARAVVGGDADATRCGTGIPARAVVGRDADATRCGTGGTPVPRALRLPLLCLLLLIPYFAFYRANIPTDTQYHQQRLKRFTTLPATTFYWLVPTGREAITQVDVALVAPFNFAMPAFWLAQLGLVAYLVALREGIRTRLGGLGWLGSLLAYAPLMPVLPLMHYYYLPGAFRAFWAGILLLCLLTLRPTRRATSVALVDATCQRRSSPRSTS
jgi:hypothetical protein